MAEQGDAMDYGLVLLREKMGRGLGVGRLAFKSNLVVVLEEFHVWKKS